MAGKDPRVLLGVYAAEVRQFCVDMLYKYPEAADTGVRLVDSPDDISVHVGTAADFEAYSSPPSVQPDDMGLVVEVRTYKRRAQSLRDELKNMFNFLGEAHVSRQDFEADVYAVHSFPMYTAEMAPSSPRSRP